MQAFLKKYLRYLGILLSVGLLILLFYNFSDIFTWIAVAWIFSLLGSPIMNVLEKIQVKGWGLPASIRALLVIFIFYGVFALFLYAFVPIIIQQGRNLANVDYQSIASGLEEPIAHFNDWLVERGFSDGPLSEFAHADAKDSTQTKISTPTTTKSNTISVPVHLDSLILDSGDSIIPKNLNINLSITVPPPPSGPDTTLLPLNEHGPMTSLRNKLFEYMSPAQIITRTVFYTVNFFGNFMIFLASVSFITFFFLKDEKLFGRAIKALVPNKHTSKSDTALAKIKQMLVRYFAGILGQISFITFYLFSCLTFFSIPNALLIAFFAAIMNVIPYLGPIIGGVFAALVTISSTLDVSFYDVTLPMLLQLIGVFASMQFIDGFILQPYIFSNSVSAHPLEIFIIVIVGAKLGGITGMVVAIPIYTVIRVIASVFLQEFKLVQKLTQSLNQAPDEEEPPKEQVDIEIE